MALVVPLNATANQALTVTLGGQVCQINVYQKFFGLFMDLYVDNSLIIAGVLCENLNRVVLDAYFNFIGDFCWYDTQGLQDPNYIGLGTRYLLIYLEKADLATGTVTAGKP